MERRQHSRFHAAVLRNLFQESFSPALPPTSLENFPSDVPILAQHIVPTEDVANRHSDIEEDVAKRHSDIEDGEISKTSLSRAQRKRRKVRKLKEKRCEGTELATQDRKRRLIGPFLPESQFNSKKESPEPSCRISLDNLPQGNSASAGSPVSTELAEEGKSTYDGDVHPHSWNRSKKRRLAKKLLSENSTRYSSGSVFTAEVKGNNVIIKRTN